MKDIRTVQILIFIPRDEVLELELFAHSSKAIKALTSPLLVLVDIKPSVPGGEVLGDKTSNTDMQN